MDFRKISSINTQESNNRAITILELTVTANCLHSSTNNRNSYLNQSPQYWSGAFSASNKSGTVDRQIWISLAQRRIHHYLELLLA